MKEFRKNDEDFQTNMKIASKLINKTWEVYEDKSVGDNQDKMAAWVATLAAGLGASLPDDMPGQCMALGRIIISIVAHQLADNFERMEFDEREMDRGDEDVAGAFRSVSSGL